MLLRLLKSNRNAGLLLFLLIILGFCVIQLKTGEKPKGTYEQPSFLLFGLLDRFLDSYFTLKTLLASLLVFIVGIQIFGIYRNYLFPNSWSYMPVILFVLITFGLPEYGKFHPVWISSVFLLLGLNRLFSSYDVRKPFRNMFEAGFFLSLGSLFYFNQIFLLIIFIIGAAMMARDAGWREPVQVFLGGLVPWVFAFSACFLVDQIPVLLEDIRRCFSHTDTNLVKNIPLLSYFAFLGYLVIAGSIRIIKQYAERKVKFRRYFYFLFWFFFSVLLVFFLMPGASSETFVIAVIPVSFLLSNYLETMKKLIFGEIILVLIIGFAVIMKFFG
jgi:hypothetical protein